ncbi:MAG TPA: DUF3185 family protein [Planctomycetota bacterium]|nr:DUF3185 family protein [Planctomycetota bacterium]
MNRIAGIAVLVAGLGVFLWGLNTSDSLGSNISEIFTDAPAQRTLWLLIGGGLLAAAGLGSILFPTGRKPA